MSLTTHHGWLQARECHRQVSTIEQKVSAQRRQILKMRTEGGLFKKASSTNDGPETELEALLLRCDENAGSNGSLASYSDLVVRSIRQTMRIFLATYPCCHDVSHSLCHRKSLRSKSVDFHPKPWRNFVVHAAAPQRKGSVTCVMRPAESGAACYP